MKQSNEYELVYSYIGIKNVAVFKRKMHEYMGEKRTNKRLTEYDWKQCLIYFNNSCAYCGTHEDDTKGVLEKEHIVPLSKLGSFDVSNIIPACHTCNASKGNREMKSWFKSRTFFSKQKLNKILNYIEKVS